MFHPSDIYAKHFTSIKNIKFTPREIDIIACMLSGKAAGVIAFFLEVSARTIETHMLNIRTKVGCGSRNGIIEFIEKSDKLHLLKQHYQKLLIESAFQKTLKKIQKTIQQNPPRIHLIIDRNAHASFLECAEEYFKLMGFKVSSSSSKKKGPLSSDPMDLDYVIYGVDQESVTRLDTKSAIESLQKHLCPQSSKHPAGVIFAMLGGNYASEALKNFDCVDFRNLEGFYFSMLELLKKILPYVKMETFIKDFSEQYAGVKGPAEPNNLNTSIAKKEISSRKEALREIWGKIFKHNKLFLIAPILFIMIILWGLILKSSDSDERYNNRIINSVRSDLIIPGESGLLKRPELLDQIGKKLNQQKDAQSIALVGIVGMGGVGKTTVARQFGRLQDLDLIWEINAESKDSLINSFKDLASVLAKTKDEKEELELIRSIQNPEEKEKQLLLFVKTRLKALQNWLLICDNVDSFSDIKDYLPQDHKAWGNGKVIITTIDGNIQNTSYMNSENIIQLGELTPSESLSLLSKILYGSSPKKLSKYQIEKALNFLKNIPPFPLDISVAAYYIKDTAITYEEYLARIGQYNKTFEETQEDFIKSVSNYTKTRYEIITLSFKKLIEVNPHYKDLLLLICLLDSRYIPKDLLKIYKNSSMVDHFIHDLRHYSLIATESTVQGKQAKTLFSLHRTTQSLGKKFILNLLTEVEIKNLLDEMILSIKNFNGSFSERKSSNIITLLPHLEAFLQNVNVLPISEKLKAKYRKDLLLMIGYAHLNGTKNYKLAEKALSQVYQWERIHRNFSDYDVAVILKDLREIYGILELSEKAIAYSQESIKLLSKLNNSEVVLIENLKNIGYAHANQNHFEASRDYLNMALDKLSKLDAESNKELKADIYDLLTWLYSSKYLTKHHTYDGINYALKALAIVGGDQLFYEDPSQNVKKISCSIAKHRMFLGYAYRRLGKYKEAMDQGFKEAEYLIENTLDTCSNNFWKAKLDYGVGDVMLREGRLKLAEEKLTKAIKQSEILVGNHDSITAKIFRAESRIRLNKLKEAYEDCNDIFKVRKKSWTNYERVLYTTCFYHGGVIKYKQEDLQKSMEHFAVFVQCMKEFCKDFLDEKAYENLEAKGVFKIFMYDQKRANEDIRKYLKNSVDIFTAIYGASHLFVLDYIIPNYKKANKAWYKLF